MLGEGEVLVVIEVGLGGGGDWLVCEALFDLGRVVRVDLVFLGVFLGVVEAFEGKAALV